MPERADVTENYVFLPFFDIPTPDCNTPKSIPKSVFQSMLPGRLANCAV